jgi:hypothetical protein
LKGVREGMADILNRLQEAQQAGLWPILVGKNGRSGHQHIGPGMHRQRGHLDVNIAINLQLTVRVALLQ